MTIMSNTSIVNSRVLLAKPGSPRRSALRVRAAKGARRSVIRHISEGTEQINDVPEPTVDQSKTENIQPGNISNENAEKRADIGATRPPTLFGVFLF